MLKYILVLLISISLFACQEESTNNNTSNSERNEVENTQVSTVSNKTSSSEKEVVETQGASEIKEDSNDDKGQLYENEVKTSSEKDIKTPPKETVGEESSDSVEEIVAIESKDDKVEKTDKDENLHKKFDDFLKKYVSSTGEVNYKSIKQNESELNEYLNTLKNNPIQSNWNNNKKLAYWINAYNAFTIKRIVDNYPLNSIMDLDGGKTWDVKWIKIGNKTYSLNQIEHEIIRPQFNDARIHFAVNCAAKSCPPLFNRAYDEHNLNSFLEKRTKQFINDNNYNQISANKAQVSKIFEWYKEDFGDLRSYINKYSNTKLNSNAEIKFKEYDWSLNE